MKFSTILHLNSYHRDYVVNKVIDARDARRKIERMSNKRKVVEYAERKHEARNEPLSKIFKPSELNDLTSVKDSDDVEMVTAGVFEGTVDGPESIEGASVPKSSSTVGPEPEISDKVQSIPKLEPKKEPKELETGFENIPEEYKYNLIKMAEREIIKKLLKIIERREQTAPQKYKKLWKCLICNEIFDKKPFATRHIYCVHEKLLQRDFKVSEMPDHPKLKAIYRPEGSKEITEDDKFLQKVKNEYDEGTVADQKVTHFGFH